MQQQTLEQIIAGIQTYNSETFVYAETVNGAFTALSPAAVLELTEEEMDMKIPDVVQKDAQALSTSWKTSIIQDMMEEFDAQQPTVDLKEVVERIIHYTEYDA